MKALQAFLRRSNRRRSIKNLGFKDNGFCVTVTFGKSKKGDTAKMKAHGSGSNPGWSTNGGYGLIAALKQRDFLS